MNQANKQQHHARRYLALVFALVGLMSAATLATGPIRPASAQTEARSWSYTGSLNEARYNHTATLLADGKVLVVGGFSKWCCSDFLRSAELYDPEILDPAPKIISASVSGKKLFLTGENFDDGAVILLNGEEKKTKQPAANPQTTLIGKKAGKKIKPGDRVQVRNADGTLSEEFIFTGS